MRFLLLIRAEEGRELGAEEEAALVSEASAWVSALDERRMQVEGGRLQPSGDATCVRRRDGAVLIADGPLAEAKEQVGGFHILECADLDAAVKVAAGHPVARFGAVEVRALCQP